MSIECAYCERDLRGGHADDCPRAMKGTWLPPDEVEALRPERDEARAEVRRLKAENERMRSALDAIYNHNEAARAAVIEHYGIWHGSDSRKLLTPRAEKKGNAKRRAKK